jgi:hypothetical protein
MRSSRISRTSFPARLNPLPVRPRSRWHWTLALVVAIAAFAATFAVAASGGDPDNAAPKAQTKRSSKPAAAADTANLWVRPGGNDGHLARRCAKPCRYSPARAYGSFVAAAAAAAARGDVIRVKAGTYGPQGSIGSTGKQVTFIGERKNGHNAVVVDSGAASGGEAYNTFNLSGGVTVRHVDVTGDYPIVQYFGSDNQWRDSKLTGRLSRRCDSDEPLLVQDDESGAEYTITDNILGPGMTIGSFRGQRGGCEGDGNFHLEQMRIGQGVRGFLVTRTRFERCVGTADDAGCGSGHIFLTTVTGLAPPVKITIRDSRFFGTPNKAIETNANIGTTAVDYTIAYNTFENNPIVAGSAIRNVAMIGNLGPREQICTPGFTWTKNVWQHSVGSPCGTDKLVRGPSYSTSALKLDDDFRLRPGSPAIDAGERTGRHSYCTATLSRHASGAACDAGAEERGKG